MAEAVLRRLTAGSVYYRPPRWLAGFWVIALLGVDLAMSGGLGDISVSEVERRDVIISAAAQAAMAGVGLWFLTCQALLRAKNLFVVRRRDRVAFQLFLAWTAIVTLAALQGVASGYEIGYILGDTYRFLAFPLYFLITYFSIRTRDDLDGTLKGLLTILGALLLYDLVTSVKSLEEGYRFWKNSLYYSMVFAPLIIYFLRERQSPLFRIASWALLMETVIAFVFYGGVQGLIVYPCGLLLFAALGRNVRLAFVSVASAAVAVLVLWSAEELFPPQIVYARAKIELASESVSFLEKLERVEGGRHADIVSIALGYTRSPEYTVVGFGMGSSLLTEPLGPRDVLPHWARERHYIHEGFFEVLFRTGLGGTAAFLALLGQGLRRGYRLFRDDRNRYGLFAAVNVLFQLGLLMTNANLMITYLTLCVSMV